AKQKDIATLEKMRATAKILIDREKARLEELQADEEKALKEMRIKEGLFKSGATQKQVLDAFVAAYKAARAKALGGSVAIRLAESDHEVAQAKVEEAMADLKVKHAHILVAEEDKRYAEERANFAKIRAPFNGEVVSRNVDPGAFVQNATTG